MDQLIKWLEENIPEDDERRCLVHGDFRLDNLLLTQTKINVLQYWIGSFRP